MTAPPDRVTVLDRSIEVLDLPARAAGPPVVLLHEGLGSVAMWRRFPEQVARATGRRVVAYSRAGYGRSGPAGLPRRPDYMHVEAEAVLPDLLDRMGVDSPILVGHSDGASIALIHAGGDRPVSAVVAMAPHVFVEECTIDGARAAREAFRHGDLRSRLGRYHDDVDAAFRGWNDIWLAAEFRPWSIEDRLPAVRVPVLLVQCRDDPYGTLDQLDRIESGVAGPVERLVFETGGHAPHTAHPEAILRAVVRLVNPAERPLG